MRAAVGAFLVLLTLCQGEALRCNFCFSDDSYLCTPTSIQTCSGRANACGAVIFQGALRASFRQCMNMAVCQGYITTPGASFRQCMNMALCQSYVTTPGVIARCCSTDLCN